jgi:hypothetical protein
VLALLDPELVVALEARETIAPRDEEELLSVVVVVVLLVWEAITAATAINSATAPDTTARRMVRRRRRRAAARWAGTGLDGVMFTSIWSGLLGTSTASGRPVSQTSDRAKRDV